MWYTIIGLIVAVGVGYYFAVIAPKKKDDQNGAG